jgi:Xaa-Pro aminopeptidase
MGTRSENGVEAGRRRRLATRLKREGLDALLVTSPANVRYLSGFTGEDSYLLVRVGAAVLLTDGRFAEQARLDCPRIEHFIRKGSMAAAVAAAVRGDGAPALRRVGLEAAHVSLSLFAKLAKLLSRRLFRQTHDLVEDLRLVKDAHELSAIREAVRVAQDAFKGLIARGAKSLVGRSEAEVAAELDYRMRQLGAEAASFPTIVAAGAHAALPHYRPGATRIRSGQGVLFDWGAIVEGYCSDLTRVVFVGRIPPQLGRIYEVVHRAQAAGIAAVKAGRSVRAVDAAAREVIAEAGFGEQFGHGLGHGVGLEIHEGPTMGARAKGRLRRGNVVTVEPGIYLPGVGGVRIEDDVLVRSGRAEVLSNLPSRLQAMVLK